METILQGLVYLLCTAVPLGIIAVLVISWLLGTELISIPGVSRGSEKAKGSWIALPAFSAGLAKLTAVISGGAGSVIGFFGFLLPWFKVEIGGGLTIAGQEIGAKLGGQVSGIGLAFYSLVAGFNVIGSKDAEAGTVFLGIILILFSLILFLIPVLLGILAALGIGMIAAPLKLIKARISGLARIMLPVSLVGSCLVCLVFAVLQATIGGVGITGSVSGAGSMAAGLQPAGGFLLTVCGLLLTILSAVTAISIAPAIEEWTKTLS